MSRLFISPFSQSLFILTFIFILIIYNSSVIADTPSWDKNWMFSQKINIDFNTSLEGAKNQPIDFNIEFDSLCWAKNDIQHSIRVCCWHNMKWYELESQIYNLEKTKESYIQSCNVIFLIPEFADGTEEYYIYYDDNEKPNIQYQDRVSISESYYHYEPISGYPIESYYYYILDDGTIPYIVTQEGQFMGYDTGQHVTKLIDNATEVLPKNGDLFAAFDFKYFYDHGVFDYSSTSQKLVSKEVFIDGNLMLSFGMISTSKLEDLKTTTIYTYYHCPSSNSRMRVHVKHECLKEISGLLDASTDGIFATLQSTSVKSNSIKDLNIGNILPYMHFINEYNEIFSYNLDTDPDYIPENPDIRIVSYEDNVDLGNRPWISFNNGEQGRAHAVLFHSNQILISGTDENDGLQLNAFQMDYPHLPGFENNIATIQIGRNSYDLNSIHDVDIPENFIAEFDAEFFTSRTNGISSVKNEAEIYNLIINRKTSSNTDYDPNYEENNKHTLSIFIHQSPSFPFGSSLSAASGLNLSFITVELFENNMYLSSETAGRIPMNALDQEASTIKEKIKALIGIIDYKNVSLRKKVVFNNVKSGMYTIKVFLENSLYKSNRQYIGFAEVEVFENKKINIYGRKQQTLTLTILDQNKEHVNNAEVMILQGSGIVSTGFTDEEGTIILSTPFSIDAYKLIVLLNGEVCYNDTLQLKRLQLEDYDYEITIERYNINIDIKDQWALSPGIDVTPILLNQKEKSLGHAETISSSLYKFSSLAPSEYTVILQYKSFSYKEKISLQKDTSLSIIFPAIFTVDILILDNHGFKCSDITLVINREGKEERYQNKFGSFHIEIPPGIYKTKIYHNNLIIGKQNLTVNSDSFQEYVTNKESIQSMLFFGLIFGVTLITIYFYYMKKESPYYQKILPIIILLLSLISPWWYIQGSTNIIDTLTRLFLIPSKLITVTTSSAFITGNQGYLPDLFLTMIQSIIGIIIFTIFLIALLFYMQIKKGKKLLILELITIILLLGCAIIFIFGMSTLSEISVGSFIGSGVLDISIIGKVGHEKIPCNWGPSIGFYLFITSIIIFVIPFLINLKKDWERKIDRENLRKFFIKEFFRS